VLKNAEQGGRCSASKPEARSTLGLSTSSVALMFLERSYNRIADLMPTFIELCKGRLKTDDEDYAQ